MLHFRDHGSWVATDAARRLRRQLDGSRNQGLDPGKYLPLVGDAMRRAAELEQRHRSDRTPFPHDNPSSGMHRLVSSALSL